MSFSINPQFHTLIEKLNVCAALYIPQSACYSPVKRCFGPLIPGPKSRWKPATILFLRNVLWRYSVVSYLTTLKYLKTSAVAGFKSKALESFQSRDYCCFSRFGFKKKD